MMIKNGSSESIYAVQANMQIKKVGYEMMAQSLSRTKYYLLGLGVMKGNFA